MLVKITTKHASYSLVTFVTHKRFAVLYFLPSRCVNSLFTSQRSAKRERIRSVILLVLSCISSSSRFLITVAEPDHQIRDGEGGGGGAGHPDPEIRGWWRSPKTLFSALRASFWSKNKGGPPLDPPLNQIKRDN